jgi:nuclear transport factor 2 (NTF2) superfamily protein
MRDTLKILLAKARLDDAAAVKSLLLPIKDYGNLTSMFSERRSGVSYAYEEDARVGRFIASNGVTVMSFSVTGVTRQEAASIAQECEQIAVWDMYEIRKAADRALGTSAEE